MSSSPEPQTNAASMNGLPRQSAGPMILFVAFYAAAVYLPWLGTGRTLTSHEVMITQPALQLLNDGQWIVPRYAGIFWLDKPPLVNWITAAFFAAFGGFSEWTARLPSALSAISLCVLVAWLTSRLFGRTAGLFAGLIQATCVYGFKQGRLGEIDMPFALLIAAAHTALLLRWSTGRPDLPLGFALAFHGFSGLAVLAKGPVAVALVAATIFAYALAVRSWKPVTAVLFSPAIVLFLLIVIPWHVAAVVVAGDEAWKQWAYNYLYRFAGKIHLAPKSVFVYFYSIPWMAAPWIVVPFFYFRRTLAHARGPHTYAHRFLWAWFIGGFIFLNVSSFKAEHYAIPILPPLSLIAALLVAEDAVRFGRRSTAIYTSIFGVALAAYLIVGGVVMPRRDHRLPTVEFIRTSVNTLAPDARLAVVGLGQHSAYPYITHSVEYLNDLPDVQAAMNTRPSESLFVLTLRKHLATAVDKGIPFEEIASEPPRENTRRYPLDELLVLARSCAQR